MYASRFIGHLGDKNAGGFGHLEHSRFTLTVLQAALLSLTVGSSISK